MSETRTVLAIDPGSSKIGMAIATRHEDDRITLDWREITPREGGAEVIAKAVEDHSPNMLVMGDGTGSSKLIAEIREVMPSAAILQVDEKDTTMKARERYWEHNPRRGWRRFLPATLQVPPDAYDDFSALILAERVLSSS